MMRTVSGTGGGREDFDERSREDLDEWSREDLDELCLDDAPDDDPEAETYVASVSGEVKPAMNGEYPLEGSTGALA